MKTILVIDDLHDNLSTISAVLLSNIPKCDCRVITALSGKEGIKLAITEQPDTILLDVIMPEMDGFEVCRILKSDEATKHIPIIFLTALKTDPADRIKGLNLGAEAFVAKPVDGLELVAQIKVMLRIKEAEDILRNEKMHLQQQVNERTVELSLKNKGLLDEIQERKKVENELQKVSDHFKAIIEKAPDGIVLLDENSRFKYISPSAKKMFGYKDGDEINTDPSLLAHSDDLPAILENVEKLMFDPAFTPVLQFRILDSKGKWRWIEATFSNFLNELSVQAIVVNFHEITEQKKAREALVESEQKMRLMISNSPVGVSTTDLKGLFIDVNPALCKIVGYSREEMLGNHYNKFSHPDDRDKNHELFSQLVDGQISYFDLEKRYIHKEGHVVHVRIRAQLIHDENGRPLFQTAIIEDITEQKETKEILVKQEAWIRSIFKSAPVGIGVTVDRIIKQVNNRLCDMIGYQPDELFNKSTRIFYLTDDEFIRVGKEKYEDIRKFGIGTIETQFRCKSGKIIDVILSTTPINPGEPDKGVTFTVLDITERKRGEKALRENEHKLRNIFENSTSVFYSHTTDNLITELSPQIETLLGYTREEAMVKWTNLISDHPANQLAIEYTQNAIEKGERQPTYELELVRKDGEKIWVEVREFPVLENGKTVSVSGSLVDITERKKAEQLQRVLYNISQAAITSISIEELIQIIQKQLGTIIDTRNFYIAFYDEKTDMFTSPIIYDEVDKLEQWPAGKSLSAYVTRSGKPLIATLADVMRMKEKGEVELVGTTAEVWMGVPLFADGKTMGVFALQNYKNPNAYTVRDLELIEFVAGQIGTMLSRKNAEVNLRAALRKANESDRLKSAFLATMSHELRTPLNAIIGFSDFLREPMDSREVVKFAEIINSSGNHLLSIVNDLFDITLIESGEIVLRENTVLIRKTIDDVKKIIDSKIKRDEKGHIDFVLSFPKNIEKTEITVDENKLKQILINLLKNAFKFTEEGKVSLEVKPDYSGARPILKIRVTDTGIGIEREKQEIIFDLFRQVEDTTARKYGGTGIGLSVVKKLTEILGGNIWVESEPGKGSTFYVDIPFKGVEPVEDTEDKPFAGSTVGMNKKTVLVAEDDEPSYMYIRVILEKLGVNVLWAKNGEEAVAVCTGDNEVNLVLMDINMPVMNGYDATRRIKSVKPELPVIAQTAYAVAGDAEKTIRAGCDDYISKPIRQDLLIEKIGRFLNEDV